MLEELRRGWDEGNKDALALAPECTWTVSVTGCFRMLWDVLHSIAHINVGTRASADVDFSLGMILDFGATADIYYSDRLLLLWSTSTTLTDLPPLLFLLL